MASRPWTLGEVHIPLVPLMCPQCLDEHVVIDHCPDCGEPLVESRVRARATVGARSSRWLRPGAMALAMLGTLLAGGLIWSSTI